MRYWILRPAGLGFAAMLAAASSASATAFCEVKPTPDGFVALRAEPKAGSRLLVQVRGGDDVQIDSTRKARAGWMPVIYRGPAREGNVVGWMRASLIARDCG